MNYLSYTNKPIHKETAFECWKEIIKRIVSFGKEVLDERGSKTTELLNIVATIEDIENSEPWGYWDGDKLEAYEEQFMSDDRAGFVYTYGNRLRAYPEDWDNPDDPFLVQDQINNAIKRLKITPNSRRATAVTLFPLLDGYRDEIPCMIMVDFKIRRGKLHTTGVWRSHDLYGAWPPNIFGLRAVARYVADNVGVDVGPMTVQSISAHIYEHNLEEAKRWFK